MAKVIKAIVVLLVFVLASVEANAQIDTKVVVIPMGDDKPVVRPLGSFVASGDKSHKVYIGVNLSDGTFTARVGTAPTASESLSFETWAGPFKYVSFNGIWDSVSNTGDSISNPPVNSGYAFQSTLTKGSAEYVLFLQIWESNSAEITIDNVIVVKK